MISQIEEDHPSDARGTKRMTEDEGEHEEAKREDSMIVSCLREEELTRIDDPRGCMQERTWDDIDGQELEPEVVRKSRAAGDENGTGEDECVREKIHRRVLRKRPRSRPPPSR